MDKSPGDQLNRAYEAYRQACMDKERFKTELQQKEEIHEEQLREYREEIDNLRRYNIQLTSQVALLVADANKLPQSPKPDNKDGWASDNTSNMSLEQLQQQFRATSQQEKLHKEQLDLVNLRFSSLEWEQKKLKLTLFHKNKEVEHLKTLLKEANEKREQRESRTIHGHEAEMKSKNLNPDPSAAPVYSENERQNIEQVFSDIKEQFSRICKLTRKQSSLLNRFHGKREIAAGNDPLMQFSMPIQCTDEDSQKSQIPEKPITRMDPSHFTSITPRGSTPDEDLTVSVESLSNLSVKFPPNTDHSEFLQSSTEKLPVVPLRLEQSRNSNKIHVESPLNLRKFCPAVGSPPYSPHSPKTVCHVDNFTVDELGPNYKDSFVAGAEDSSLFLAAKNPAGECTKTFRMSDIPNLDESMEVAKRTVRGPEQPVWKPSSHKDDAPSIGVGDMWDEDGSDKFCEFCQAVFPISLQDDEKFLRHLNTHFLHNYRK